MIASSGGTTHWSRLRRSRAAPFRSVASPRAVESDLGARQCLGDRTALLGLARLLLEGGIVDARHLRFDAQLDAADPRPPLRGGVQMHGGGGGDAARGMAGAFQGR